MVSDEFPLEAFPVTELFVGDKTLLLRLGGATGADDSDGLGTLLVGSEGSETPLDDATEDLDLALSSLAVIDDFTFCFCIDGFVAEKKVL